MADNPLPDTDALLGAMARMFAAGAAALADSEIGTGWPALARLDSLAPAASTLQDAIAGWLAALPGAVRALAGGYIAAMGPAAHTAPPDFAALRAAYDDFAARATELAGDEGVSGQIRFFTRLMVEALNPDNFPHTNPAAIARALATRGESLATGMENLAADLSRGQLTHSDPAAFRPGDNIADTPGKVVYETPLFQLIQYTPTTPGVLATPLVIFPPWINRFYILDLGAKKSFVRWAVAQRLSVFMVSWKSADASMADVVWDDYIGAEVEAVDVVCARLKVPAAHVMGYCLAGTTLAATLAVLAARGEAGKIASATFLAAQVDFELAGDLALLVDDRQIALLEQLSPEGWLDGRVMALAFNLLRARELIWQPAIEHYLLGEPYRPFDLLHWNADTTNLPIRWLTDYLRDLYRDNLLVKPGALSALGVPIVLGAITTRCFIQAAREDHIAPAPSVWRLTQHLAAAEWQFILAGSGHIAGVVNPAGSAKYGYWTQGAPAASFSEFVAGAHQHEGSWWAHWLDWLREAGTGTVAASGARIPGGRGNKALEDAPGRYVRAR